jgi:hypothetical protein
MGCGQAVSAARIGIVVVDLEVSAEAELDEAEDAKLHMDAGRTSSPWLSFFFWCLKHGVGGREGIGRKDTKPPALSGGGGSGG